MSREKCHICGFPLSPLHRHAPPLDCLYHLQGYAEALERKVERMNAQSTRIAQLEDEISTMKTDAETMAIAYFETVGNSDRERCTCKQCAAGRRILNLPEYTEEQAAADFQKWAEARVEHLKKYFGQFPPIAYRIDPSEAPVRIPNTDENGEPLSFEKWHEQWLDNVADRTGIPVDELTRKPPPKGDA